VFSDFQNSKNTPQWMDIISCLSREDFKNDNFV
jgi:hypothetical protein